MFITFNILYISCVLLMYSYMVIKEWMNEKKNGEKEACLTLSTLAGKALKQQGETF